LFGVTKRETIVARNKTGSAKKRSTQKKAQAKEYMPLYEIKDL